MNRYPPYYRSLDDEKPKSYVTVKRQYGDEPLTKAEKNALREREERLDREQRELMSRIRSRWQEIAIEEDRKQFEKIKTEHGPLKQKADNLDSLFKDDVLVFDSNDALYVNGDQIGIQYKIGDHQKIVYLGYNLDTYIDIIGAMAKKLENDGPQGLNQRVHKAVVYDGLIEPLRKLMSNPDGFSVRTKEFATDIANDIVHEDLAVYFSDDSYKDPKKFAAIVKAFKEAVTRIEDNPTRIGISAKTNAEKVILNAIKEVATSKMKMKSRVLQGGKPTIQQQQVASPVKDIQ